MKPTVLRLVLSVIALVSASGCVLSEQPLSAVKDARPDQRLVGIWHGEKDADSKQDVRVSYDSQGIGRLSKPGEDIAVPAKPDSITFFVTKTNKASYLNVLTPDDDKQPDKGKHYQFFKYTVSEDQKALHLWTTKLPPFQKAVREAKLKGHVDSSDGANPEQRGVVLQDSSETILQFLESLPPEEAFAELDVCRKVD